jgi:cephalosporin hydroxylase
VDGRADAQASLRPDALQELITRVQPALIIETGTARSADRRSSWRTSATLIGHGQVITIDLEPDAKLPQHPRITYRVGSSVDPEIVAYVQDRAARCGGPVLVLLDSDHRAAHVAAELAVYAPLVTSGSFCVVEDTNVNGNPVLPEFGPGPAKRSPRSSRSIPSSSATRCRTLPDLDAPGRLVAEGRVNGAAPRPRLSAHRARRPTRSPDSPR